MPLLSPVCRQKLTPLGHFFDDLDLVHADRHLLVRQVLRRPLHGTAHEPEQALRRLSGILLEVLHYVRVAAAAASSAMLKKVCCVHDKLSHNQ